MVRRAICVLAFAILLTGAGCGGDNPSPAGAATDGALPAGATLLEPGGALRVQVDEHPGYESAVEVPVDCVANRLSAGSEGGLLFRLAPKGTVSCEGKYLEPDDMTDRDFLFAFLVAADETLEPGEPQVKWAQLHTRHMTSTSWIGAQVTIEAVDEERIKGKIRAGDSVGQPRWSIQGEFVAERCKNQLGE